MLSDAVQALREPSRPFQYAIRLGTILSIAPLFIITLIARSASDKCIFMFGFHFRIIELSILLTLLYGLAGLAILYWGIQKWLDSDILEATKKEDKADKLEQTQRKDDLSEPAKHSEEGSEDVEDRVNVLGDYSG